MAYANLEGGDRVAMHLESGSAIFINGSGSTQTNGNNQLGIANSLAYQRDPNAAILVQYGDTHGVSNDTGEYPVSATAPSSTSLRYVLSPSPSFDPVFDDLLEGGTGSGTSSGQEHASTKSENAPTDESTRKIEYLNELLRDEKKLEDVPEFHHLQKLIRREIEQVRGELRLRKYSSIPGPNFVPFEESNMFHRGRFSLGPMNEMPPAEGPIVTIAEKVYAPIEQYPTYNFIGRLVGPRGRTVKQIELESGCQITIRGRGSERNNRFEGRKTGQLAYEHENETLHVRIAATDHKERAVFKVCRAKHLVQQLLVPVEDDELKQEQLRELAHIRYSCRRLRGPPPTHQPMSTEESYTQFPSSSVPPPPHMPPNQFQFTVPPMVAPYYFIDADPNNFVPMVWPHGNTFGSM